MLTCENLPYPKHQKLFFCLCLTELTLSCLLCSRTSIFQDDKQTLDFVERSWYLYRVILQNKGNPSEEFQKVEANYAASVKRWSKPCNALCLRLVGSQASAILRPQWTCWNAQKLQSKQLEQLGACMTAEKMTWQGHIGDIPRSNMKGIDKCIATVEVSCGIGRCYLVCPYH